MKNYQSKFKNLSTRRIGTHLLITTFIGQTLTTFHQTQSIIAGIGQGFQKVSLLLYGATALLIILEIFQGLLPTTPTVKAGGEK